MVGVQESFCLTSLSVIFFFFFLFLPHKGSSCEASLNHPQGPYEVCCYIYEGTKTAGSTQLVDSCHFCY
jgi:hypothetical protein